MMGKCLWCEKEINSKNRQRRYCSKSCISKAHEDRKKKRGFKPIACVWCGKLFTPNSEGGRYCSVECRDSGRFDAMQKHRKLREVSGLTRYLCHKWYVEGLSVKVIGDLLNRREDQIREILDTPLTKTQYKTMLQYLDVRGTKNDRAV